MATETFASMPPGHPVTLDEEPGWPNIRLDGDDVILEYSDQTITIPGGSILKHSPTVHVGDQSDVNKLSLTIFACRIDVENCRDDVRVRRETIVKGRGYED